MTEVVESSTADQSERGEVRDSPEPEARPVSDCSNSSMFAAIDGWRGVGWLSCGVAGGLAIAWFILLAPGQTGAKSDWFFGAAVLVAAMVVMWQTANVQRQANRRAAEATDRLRHAMAVAEQRSIRDRVEAEQRSAGELAAAEERAARELAQTRELHRAEMESRQKSHRAE